MSSFSKLIVSLMACDEIDIDILLMMQEEVSVIIHCSSPESHLITSRFSTNWIVHIMLSSLCAACWNKKRLDFVRQILMN